MTREEKIEKVKALLSGEKPELVVSMMPDFTVYNYPDKLKFKDLETAQAYLDLLNKRFNVTCIRVVYIDTPI